jgi:two-component system response regulator NreC
MAGHLQLVGRDASANSPKNGLIRVLLANDHARLRRNLRDLLEREHDIRVIAEASDLKGITHQLRTHQPEVLVLDASMSDGSTVERIQQLREQAPRTQTVLITMDKNRTLAEQALRAGALGFVLKDSADSELGTAVRSAARCQQYTSPRLDHA